jgi:hypothetical protein
MLTETETDCCANELPHVEHYIKLNEDNKPEPAREHVSEFLVQLCAWGLGAIIAVMFFALMYKAFQVSP